MFCSCWVERKDVIHMSEISKFEEQKKKLEGLCEEHDLNFRFRCNIYPMTLTLSPVTGVYEQMDMLASVEEKGYISQDASLQFIMKDGKVTHHIYGTFTIDDDLFMKFKGIFKKMVTFFTQYFFRDVIENKLLHRGAIPVIDDMADDSAEEEADPDTEDQDDEEYEFTEEDEEDTDPGSGADDALIQQAASIVRAENKATTGLLQRRLHISYSQAYQILKALESRGVIGPDNGSGFREVLPVDVPDDEAE